MAATEYQKILAHPGLDPLEILYPWLHKPADERPQVFS